MSTSLRQGDQVGTITRTDSESATVVCDVFDRDTPVNVGVDDVVSRPFPGTSDDREPRRPLPSAGSAGATADLDEDRGAGTIRAFAAVHCRDATATLDFMADGQTRHPWENWVWDETVFEGTAAYYRRGRKPYAPGLARALAEYLDLDGRGRLLDVGCGPGTVALSFAHLFESVIGLDPDPGMLAEAKRATAEERTTNASWVQMRAEDLPGALGTFRVISFGQSFHWMDRPRVASAARDMLDADGAVVQVDLWHTNQPDHVSPSTPYPQIPEAAIDELRRRWLGPDRRAGQGFRNTSPDGEDAVFQAVGFAPEEIVVVPDHRVLERSLEDVVAWVLSTSSSAPHLFGDRLGEFIGDLHDLLLDVSPEGRFSIVMSDNRLRIRMSR
jgi:SAM-dependent methyltransferase